VAPEENGGGKKKGGRSNDPGSGFPYHLGLPNKKGEGGWSERKGGGISEPNQTALQAPFFVFISAPDAVTEKEGRGRGQKKRRGHPGRSGADPSVKGQQHRRKRRKGWGGEKEEGGGDSTTSNFHDRAAAARRRGSISPTAKEKGGKKKSGPRLRQPLPFPVLYSGISVRAEKEKKVRGGGERGSAHQPTSFSFLSAGPYQGKNPSRKRTRENPSPCSLMCHLSFNSDN